MAGKRADHAAVRLLDGRVLVVGGNATHPDLFAEIYDPLTQTWSPTYGLLTPRYDGTVTLLQDGTVLFTGGVSPAESATTYVDLFDPETDNWTQLAPMSVARSLHKAVLLQDGSVLVAGGLGLFDVLSSVERYDPTSGTWLPAASLGESRFAYTLSVLNDGTVIATGGQHSSGALLNSVERYDFSTDVWTPTPSMDFDRVSHAAVVLGNGSLLVAGGYSNFAGGSTRTSELYDPSTNSWSLQNEIYDTFNLALTLLADGTVMASGGRSGGSSTWADVWIFNPVASLWFKTGDMDVSRAKHTATLLADGSVLVAGGRTGSNSTETAERYPPNQNPVANAPIQNLRVSTLDANAVPIAVGWRVAADTDPILSYFLQQKVGTGSAPYSTVALEQQQQTSKVRKLIPGSVYRFRLIAKDFRGANSNFANGTPKKLIAIQDSDTAAISYTGIWANVTNASMFGTTGKYSSTAGHSALVTFSGTNIGWVTRKSNTGGKAEIWLDGVKLTTIDLYSATLRQRQMVFVRNGLAPGTHTLEVRVLGTKSTGSAGTRVDVDAFIVLQ